uniref:Protein DIS3 homolog n=1 Tax=Timema bartmani TaxID=61472 RepID=A0A7R9ESS6_9NEOP|nr:unnamed protein product [Timema bartmani]
MGGWMRASQTTVDTSRLSEQGFGTSMAPSRVDDVIPKPLDKRIGGTVKSVVEGLRQPTEVVLDGRHIQVAMQSHSEHTKIVREHYLREDIWCGSNVCIKCPHKTQELILDEDPLSKSTLFTFPHYLVLDTCVVLNQIDVLEENLLCNVIIVQTVLDEVKHRSSVVYKRLRDILANPTRKFYTFVNEHHQCTYIERKPGEKVNDRNDRAIRVAAAWYESHLATSQPGDKKDSLNVRVILITDDYANKVKAESEGLKAATIVEYVKSLKDSTTIVDKLNLANIQYEADWGGREPLFPPHLTPTQIHEGIKSARLMQGTFLASRDNFLEGQVNIEGQDKFILVQGREGLNRAVNGDSVAIELLPEEEWSAPSELVMMDEEDESGDIADDETTIKSSVKEVEKQPTGRIVGIIRRKWRQHRVTSLFLLKERFPRLRIETRQADTLSSQRIIVAIDSWPRNSRYPLGHFVRALGKIGDKDTENEVLLLEHDVPHSKFSEAVLNCLPKLPWIITEEDEKKRVDLRHLDICSVDPPGCTDIDDALHCRDLANGNYEVNLLSSNLCSLRGNEERFAFSCIWEITRDANIVNTKFHKSIIRSRQAMTYEEAQLKIDDARQEDELSKSLRSLNSLAKILKRRRIDNGQGISSSISRNPETHDPIEVESKKLRDTNSMVEEFMLLANISVAKKILEEFPECALLRRHPTPPVSNFEPIIKAGKKLGFDININSGKELAESLDAAVRPDNPYFNTMLRILATRCMLQAVYFASGMMQKDEYAHYGLACPIYTLLFFRGRIQDEQGYVLYVRKNALQILIPKYGFEGTLYVSPRKGEKLQVKFIYNEENQSQRCGDVVFHTFDPVTVQLSLDRSNLQHERVVLQLVKPHIPNFSVPSLDASISTPTKDSAKRKELKDEPMEQDSAPTMASETNIHKKKKKKKNISF